MRDLITSRSRWFQFSELHESTADLGEDPGNTKVISPPLRPIAWPASMPLAQSTSGRADHPCRRRRSQEDSMRRQSVSRVSLAVVAVCGLLAADSSAWADEQETRGGTAGAPRGD